MTVDAPIHIKSYTWFLWGFQTVSVIFALTNFGMLLVTLLTVKGIYVPVLVIIPAVILLVMICIFTGYLLIRFSVQQRAQSYNNMNANPEIRELTELVRKIAEKVNVE